MGSLLKTLKSAFKGILGGGKRDTKEITPPESEGITAPIVFAAPGDTVNPIFRRDAYGKTYLLRARGVHEHDKAPSGHGIVTFQYLRWFEGSGAVPRLRVSKKNRLREKARMQALIANLNAKAQQPAAA